MEQNEIDVFNQLKNAYETEKTKNLQLNQALSTSNRNDNSDNIIRFRLEMDNEKNKLEHFLSGDLKIIDEKLGEVWVENLDLEERTFNKRGVRLVMEQIEIFTVKGILLSSYDIDRINMILLSIGNALLDFIVNNAEDLGMDTEYKQSKLKLIVLTTMFLIEGAYRRALGGQEGTATQPNVSIHQIDSGRLNGLPFMSEGGDKGKWKWV